MATKISVKMVVRSKVGLAINFSASTLSEHNFMSTWFLMFSICSGGVVEFHTAAICGATALGLCLCGPCE